MAEAAPASVAAAPPIHLWREGSSIPLDEDAILVAANGTFAVRHRGSYSTVEKLERPPGLAVVPPYGRWRLPKIPAVATLQMIRWFRDVYHKHHSEAILLIAYNLATGEFQFVAPQQRVSSAHLDYDIPRQPPEGFAFVGTVHSHGGMSAFHSGVDTHDEEFCSGIHLTVGSVDEQAVGIVAALAVGDHRFPHAPEDVLDGVERVRGVRIAPRPVTEEDVDEAIAFMRRRRPDLVAKYETTDGRQTIRTYLTDKAAREVEEQRQTVADTQRFRCVLPDGATMADTDPPAAWMTMLVERSVAVARGEEWEGTWVSRTSHAGSTTSTAGSASSHAAQSWSSDDRDDGSIPIYGADGTVHRTVARSTPPMGFARQTGFRQPRSGASSQATGPDASRSGVLGSLRDIAQRLTGGLPATGEVVRRTPPADDGVPWCYDQHRSVVRIGDAVRVSVPDIRFEKANDAHAKNARAALSATLGRCTVAHIARTRGGVAAFLYLDVGTDVSGVPHQQFFGYGDIPDRYRRSPEWWSRIVCAWSDHVTKIPDRR